MRKRLTRLRASRIGSLITKISDARAVWLGLGMCAWVMYSQPSAVTDRQLSDKLLVTQAHAPDPDYLLIEVTAQDLIDYGRPALSRTNMTRLLAKIRAGEPERVLVDFSADGEIKDDVQRARAEVLESFDRARLGLVTAVRPDNLPADRFVKAATMLDGRITADVDGWHRRLDTGQTGAGNNPALWLATGETANRGVAFDLRINHLLYPRVSAGDVFEGKVDVSGRKVIVSSTPDVSPTRAYLPLSETASRATVLALAAQSVEQGYPEVLRRGLWVNLVLSVLAALMGFAIANQVRSGKQLIRSAVVAIFAIMAAHLALANFIGVPITLTVAISCFIIMGNATLAHRFHIMPMMQNFLRGDLSPEEAWAWRAQEGSQQPAILFATDGSIKRANEAGWQLDRSFGEGLAAKCLPSLVERADQLEYTDADGRRHFYDLTWPYPHIPLAIGWDITEAKEQQETLLGQLYTDELTGCTNRRGFDRMLVESSRNADGYHIFFIDLNGFKAVNDTYGHDAGDELLVICSQRLKRMIRSDDCVARLGGDEFAILSSNSRGTLDPASYIDRIVDVISAPIELTALDCVVSVGAAVGHAAPEYCGEDVADVLRRADQMMYAHKRASKMTDENRNAQAA